MNAAVLTWTPDTMLLVGGAFLLAGLVKGTLGLGLPVVVIAILATVIGLQSAIALILLPSVVMNLWQAVVGGGFTALLRRLWPMLGLAVLGCWLGVQILSRSDPELLMTVLAIVLIVYSIWSLMRPQIKPPGRWEIVLTPVAGFVSGLIFGMVGNFMVPGVLYLQALGLGRERLVQALGISFVTISVAMLIFMSRFKMVDHQALSISAVAMIPGLAGMFIGQRLRRFLNEAQFRVLFFAGLLVAGGYMLVRAHLDLVAGLIGYAMSS